LIWQFRAQLSRQRRRTRMICVQPHGSVRFLHHRGGEAPREISSVTFGHECYAGFPAFGRRIANSVNPVMAMQHQREVRHPGMGFSTVPQLSAAAELGHQSGHASQSDSWIPSLRAAAILAWLMSRGMSLG
jgi:hypothetical protein